MSTSAPSLPLGLPEPARPARVRRASAGERKGARKGTLRVTSVQLRPRDEVLLDRLREAYGTKVIGEAIRMAMEDAARSRGVVMDDLPEAAAA